MSDLELFSMPLCPFAHRVRLVLAEKGITYRLTEIDLGNKAPAFLKVSPYGKVPALRHGTTHICESAIINEYLDETFLEPPLLPRDPARRARARFWIDFANARLFAVTASLLYGPHRQNPSPALEQIAAALQFIEAEALAKRPADGPYWLGPEFSLVDVTFYPWFEQLAALEQLRGIHMPSGLNRLMQWQDAVAQRSTVRAIAKPPEFYLEHYPRHEEAAAA
ncbi:MAG: glutathione S-transferase family protein [Hyphomicrobiaceae bacterium]